jgi:hypothetical protein
MASYQAQLENLLIEDIGAVKEREPTAWDHLLAGAIGRSRPRRDVGRELVCFSIPPPRLHRAAEVHA